jgi:pyruvate formate lyase activating enzyme
MDQINNLSKNSEKLGAVRGLVFDIERFAIHDGPGIRTVVFFKGCNLNCVWCSNPESKTPYPEVGYKKELCIHCLRCMNACPVGNISEQNESISLFDVKRCGECSLCVDACTQNALVKFGKYYTVEELIEIVMKDMDFYQESNGGVTFSGGEPLLQIDFLDSILKDCKRHDLHTAIETAGCVEYECFDRINEYVDLYLYDIKNLGPDIHRKYTRKSNDVIFQNLIKLDDDGKETIARVPLIPELNDSKIYIVNLFKFLINMRNLVSVHFLPYHELGKPKYEWVKQIFTPVFSKYTKKTLDRKAKEINDINRNFNLTLIFGGLE